MGAVWMRARAEMAERWRALFSAAVLCGLFGAAVLTTLSGARRTETAYPRFLETHRAYDVLVSDSSLFADVFWTPDFDALARLPYVELAVRVKGGFVRGGGDLPEGTGFVASYDPRFGTEIQRPIVVKGRLPDPSKADEIAVAHFADPATPTGARSLGTFRLGDRKQLMLGGKLVTFTVVGETAFPGDLPPSQQYGWQFLATPAFLDTYARDCVLFQPTESCGVDFVLEQQMIRFEHPSDISRFERDVKALTGGKVLAPLEQASHARAVQGSTDLQASALRLLSVFIALTAMMIIGQLLAREIAVGAAEASTLRAVGFDRAQLFGLAVLRVAPVAIGGAICSVVVAWLASPIFPRGSVRVLGSSDLVFDATIFGLGGLAVAAVTLLLVLVPGWRAAVVASKPEGAPSGSSKLATALAAIGMSTPAVTGARLALERGRGRTAVPVFSSLTIVALGIAAFVAATTFAGSLDAMLNRPELYGKSWDEVISTGADHLGESPVEQSAFSQKVAAALVSDPDVERLAFVDSGAPVTVFAPDGPPRGIPVLAMSIMNRKGDVFPPIVAGRAPVDGREALLGARMIRALGLKLDPDDPPTIEVALQGIERRGKIRVVGQAVIPPLGNFGELGYGIVFGGVEGLGDVIDDPSLAPPLADILVGWRPGADPSAVMSRYEDFGSNEDGRPIVRIGEGLTGGRFADVVNFGGVQGAPLVVGGVLAALGAAALAHVLVTAIRRRRRDLAILKTIGFVRGQARRAVAWQATTMVVVAAMVGVPLGVIGGRWLWTRVADGIGVLPRPEVSILVLAALGPAVVVVANIIAALPARAAARTQPALVLRSE